MKEHIQILDLASRGALPDQIDEGSDIPVHAVHQVYHRQVRQQHRLRPAGDDPQGGELQGHARAAQTLTGRIRELAERYATPLPKLTEEVESLTARVDEHLKKMEASWK